jgi:hypothetical protein
MAPLAISVPTETLEPGMVLAEPVFNRWGQILLTKGSELSPRHLTVLKTWGIPKAVIESGESEAVDPQIDEEILRNAEARIKKRLLWQPQNALEEEIIQLAIQQVVHRSLPWGP